MSFYLEKINDRYYFRLRVPKDLVPYLGTRQLRKCLGTSDYSSAKTLVRSYLFATEKLFVAIRSGMLTNEQIIEIVSAFRNNHLERQESRRRKIGKRAYYPVKLIDRDLNSNGQLDLSPSEINATIIDLNKEQIERLNNCLLDNDFRVVDAIANRLLREQKLENVSTEDFKFLCEYVLKALIDICEVNIQRIKGNYNNPFYLNASHVPSHLPVENRPIYKLSELWETFKRLKLAKGSWNQGTLEKNEGSFKSIIDILGDRHLSDFNDESVPIYLLENLKKYPVHKNNKKKFIGIKYSPDMANESGFQTQSDKSIQFTMGLMSSLLIFACSNSAKWGVSVNLSKGLAPKDDRDPSSLKEVYTQKEIEGLFRLLSMIRKAVEPERYWIPLIALYSGSRSNEICQLRTEDIETEKIPTIYLHHKPELKQQIKNKKSRSFPIHPTLIKLGLLTYVEEIKRKGQDRLWPNLLDKKGKWNSDFGKWYNRTLEPKFTDNEKKTFHSTRHTFINWFKQNMFKDNIKLSLENLCILKSIVGHLEIGDRRILGLNNDITLDHYGKKYSTESQFKLLRILNYEVDIKLLSK